MNNDNRNLAMNLIALENGLMAATHALLQCRKCKNNIQVILGCLDQEAQDAYDKYNGLTEEGDDGQ